MYVPTGDIVAPAKAGEARVPQSERVLEVVAKDGYTLGATLFEAAKPEGAVLLAGATGVPARFYRPFARWLAGHRNLTCLTFDFRGIATSLRGPLAKSQARLQDWGQLDLPAALDALCAHARGPTYLVGHSAGGQLVGLMPNVHQLRRIVQVAGSSGYFGNLSPRMRLTARLLMQGYLPISTRVVGYGACKVLGWGENLPTHVARQWTKWCASPGYVENAFGDTVHSHAYGEISAPILNLSFVDDTIATAANIEDLLRLFPAASIERRRFGAEDVQGRAIGHIGFFRSGNKDLWPEVADFLVAT